MYSVLYGLSIAVWSNIPSVLLLKSHFKLRTNPRCTWHAVLKLTRTATFVNQTLQSIATFLSSAHQPGDSFVDLIHQNTSFSVKHHHPIILNIYRSLALATSIVAAAVQGQQVGTQQTETHPSMTWQQCTAASSCTSKSGKVVIDSNWRWVHNKTSGSYTNCYTRNTWNTALCMYNFRGIVSCFENLASSLLSRHAVRVDF